MSLYVNKELREQTDMRPCVYHLNPLKLLNRNGQTWVLIYGFLSLPEEKEPKEGTDMQFGQVNFEHFETFEQRRPDVPLKSSYFEPSRDQRARETDRHGLSIKRCENLRF